MSSEAGAPPGLVLADDQPASWLDLDPRPAVQPETGASQNDDPATETGAELMT
jgi:hypothetical protein